MATSRQTLLCDICTKRGQTNAASGICSQCREMYCDQCQKEDQAFLATHTHKIIKFDFDEEKSDHIHCDSCMNKGNRNTCATYFCNQCRELYCEPCKQFHRFFKATCDHDVSEINITVKTQPLPTDSVNFTSDFEKFTLSDVSVSDSNSASYQDQIDHVNSSDFDGFNLKQDSDNDNLAAQFPIFQSSDGESKICLNKDDIDKMSAKVIGSFKEKLTLGKKLLDLKFRLRRAKKYCRYTGIICLNDGRLILLDKYNEKLKMFDITCNMISIEPTKGCGYGMTKISEEEIAVVSNDSLYFYKITKNRFNKERNINLGCKGHGISYNRGILAVLCNRLFKIYSTTGEEMSQISLQQGRLVNIINIDSEEDRIYLSSSQLLSCYGSTRTFSCISLHGKLIWEFDGVDGVDVVEFYKCLLVTADDGAIVLYEKDGSYRRILIQDVEHLSFAEYIAYNPATKQLYVTRLFHDDIIIIQLQSELSCRLL